MPKDGVMTTEEFGMQKSKDAKKQEKAVAKKPEPKREITEYLFPPMEGKDGSCAFYYKGEEMKLPPKAGIFKINPKWNAVKKQQYAIMLPAVGFEPIMPTVKKMKEEEISQEFSFMHPDHSEADPINGPFEVKIGKNKQKVVLEVVNGVATTKDKRVVAELKKAGFVDYTPE